MPTVPATVPESDVLDWNTKKGAFHATRVICDEMGLTVDEKNLICACIYQESEFKNTAKCENRTKAGVVWSTDWSLIQANDYFHIGPGKEFPSVEYLLANPGDGVKWMIRMYQQGHLKWWVSYASGAYRHWLSPSSPMWALHT